MKKYRFEILSLIGFIFLMCLISYLCTGSWDIVYTLLTP